MNKLLIILIMLLSAVLYAQLPPLPITEYDYHSTENEVSPIAIGMGGMNITNPKDYYSSYGNPALLASVGTTALALSYRLVNQEQYTFTEAMQISNALKDKQIKYFTLITKNAAVSYQPVSSLHISQWNPSGTESQYYDYQLDKWQFSLGGKDPAWELLSAGLNLKYLTGRLVYLKEEKRGQEFIRKVFIDDKVKGFSTDLGFAFEQGDFTWSGVVYDIFSQLYWENYDSVKLQRRSALGFEYNSGSLSLLAGVQNKIDKDPDTSYHLGLVQDWDWNTKSGMGKDINQGFIIRMGMHSKNFHGTDNINYTLGSGYNYDLLRFDFALTNQGMQLRDSEFLFSIGVGLQ